jgi:hypothetical protein
MAINWRHGLLRLWILASVVWCAAVLAFAWRDINVDWTFSADRMVHVKFSDTETWDYPKGLGLEVIRDAVKARIDQKNAQKQAWVASLPEDKKAACAANPKNKFDEIISEMDKALKNNIPENECQEIFWATAGEYAAPNDWENQLYNVPLTLWQAMRLLAPWLLGPPLLVLGLGAALLWALAGFRHGL